MRSFGRYFVGKLDNRTHAQYRTLVSHSSHDMSSSDAGSRASEPGSAGQRADPLWQTGSVLTNSMQQFLLWIGLLMATVTGFIEIIKAAEQCSSHAHWAQWPMGAQWEKSISYTARAVQRFPDLKNTI